MAFANSVKGNEAGKHSGRVSEVLNKSQNLILLQQRILIFIRLIMNVKNFHLFHIDHRSKL